MRRWGRRKDERSGNPCRTAGGVRRAGAPTCRKPRIRWRCARGRGVGTRAIDLVSRYAFEQLSLHRVYAYVLALNPRARRAFEKAGFSLEGTLRDDRSVGDGYVDSYLLSRLA